MPAAKNKTHITTMVAKSTTLHEHDCVCDCDWRRLLLFSGCMLQLRNEECRVGSGQVEWQTRARVMQ